MDFDPIDPRKLSANGRLLLTWDNQETWFIKDSQVLRQGDELLSATAQLMLGPLFMAQDSSGEALFVDFDTNQRIQLREPGISQNDIELGVPSLLSDTTLVVVQRDAGGTAKRSYWAVLPKFAVE